MSLTLDDLGPIVQPTIQLDAQQKLVSCSIQSSSETSIIWLQPQCQMWLIVCVSGPRPPRKMGNFVGYPVTVKHVN